MITFVLFALLVYAFPYIALAVLLLGIICGLMEK